MTVRTLPKECHKGDWIFFKAKCQQLHHVIRPEAHRSHKRNCVWKAMMLQLFV